MSAPEPMMSDFRPGVTALPAEEPPLTGGMSQMPPAGMSVDPTAGAAPMGPPGPIASMPEAANMSIANQSIDPRVSGAMPSTSDAPASASPPSGWMLAMAPGRSSPAREVSTLGPKAMEATKAALGLDAQAGAVELDAQQKAQLETANAYERAALETRQAAELQRAELQQRVDQYKQDNDEYKQMVRTQMAQGEIDPNRAWNNKSAFAKTASLAAVFLGGFSAGVRGGENQVLAQMEREVARDVDAQKFAREMRMKGSQQFLQGVEQNQNLIAATASMQARATADRVEALKHEINRQAALNGSKEAAAKAEALSLRLDAMHQKVVADTTKFIPAQYTPGGAVWVDPETGATMTPNQRRAYLDARGDKERELGVKEAEVNDKAGAKTIRLSDGKTMQALDAASAAKVRDIQSSGESYTQMVNEFASRLEKLDGADKTFNTQEREKVNALLEKLILAGSKAEQAGALDAGTVENFKAQFGNPDSWRFDRADQAKMIASVATRQMYNKMRPYLASDVPLTTSGTETNGWRK